jgi:molybdate transport system substrate-binding protein
MTQHHRCEAFMKQTLGLIAGVSLGVWMATVETSAAAEVKVLTAGAFKQVVLAVVPEFEKQTGHKVVVDNDTVGGLTKRIEGGDTFDVAVLTPAAVDELTKKGKIADGSKATLARVGVGVMVKAGAPVPDISTVEAFKRALLVAKSVSYIDPASGGSSGIYVARLLERLGIANDIKPKEKLKKGGYVADLIKSGEAELGIHQISEIVPVKEVTLVGPLPAEIQNYTTYAAGVGAGAKDGEAAKALIRFLSGPAAAAVLKEKGMDRPS